MSKIKEEKIEFYNDKKQKIVGLLSLPEGKNPPVVVIIHGFKGTKEYYPFVNNSVKDFINNGIAVLRIDCRGSGESDLEFKEMTMKSESEDVLTTLEYIKNREDINSEKVALVGISMGAAAVLLAMDKNPLIKTLIFWGPAWYFNGDSYYDRPEHRKTVKEEGVFHVSQKFTGKKLLAGKELFEEMTSLDVRPLMKLVKVSVLVLRGSKEEIVDTEKDKEVVELLDADYRIIEGGDHNFTDKKSEEELIRISIGWCNKWLK